VDGDKRPLDPQAEAGCTRRAGTKWKTALARLRHAAAGLKGSAGYPPPLEGSPQQLVALCATPYALRKGAKPLVETALSRAPFTSTRLALCARAPRLDDGEAHDLDRRRGHARPSIVSRMACGWRPCAIGSDASEPIDPSSSVPGDRFSPTRLLRRGIERVKRIVMCFSPVCHLDDVDDIGLRAAAASETAV
jgi:hypothetical protein